MNKLITSFISSTAQQPIEKITLDHLQGAYTEALAQIVTGMIGPSYDPAKVYVLYGCAASTPSGSLITNISAGALFANGEIFHSPAQSASFAAALPGAVIVANVGPAAPANFVDTDSPSGTQFSDGSFHQVHSVRQVQFAYDLSGNGTLNGGASVNNDFGNFLPIYPKFTSTGIIFGSSFYFSATNVGGIYYNVGYKVKDNVVTLCGAISASISIGGTYPLITLPISPAKRVTINPLTTGFAYQVTPIYIDTSGSLQFTDGIPSGSDTGIVYLDGVTFRLS